MVQYRKILELHFKGVSQRTISSSVGSSRNTVSKIIKRPKNLGLTELRDTIPDSFLKSMQNRDSPRFVLLL